MDEEEKEVGWDSYQCYLDTLRKFNSQWRVNAGEENLENFLFSSDENGLKFRDKFKVQSDNEFHL